MGIFSNPLGYVGGGPGITGTPTTQNSTVRAATIAEADAGTLTNCYLSPATGQAAAVLDFASPPVLGFGSTTPRPVHATTLSAVGAVTLNTSGAATTTIGTGGTGITNIGNATGNTAVTGSLTASTGLVATTGGVTASAGNIAASSGNVSASGTVTGGTGVTATTGNVVATAGAVNAGTSMTATAGDITATLGNVIINGAAKQLRCHGGAVTDFIGQVTLTNGTADVANTNIAATDRVIVTRSAKNGSTAYGTPLITVTASTKFNLTACKSDTTTETGDASTFDYFIVRQV